MLCPAQVGETGYILNPLRSMRQQRQLLYGNFDIILGQFLHSSQPHATCHAPYDMLYFVLMLIGCELVLEFRCCA